MTDGTEAPPLADRRPAGPLLAIASAAMFGISTPLAMGLLGYGVGLVLLVLALRHLAQRGPM